MVVAILEQLKAVQATGLAGRLSIEELLTLSSLGRGIVAEAERSGANWPLWVSGAVQVLDATIKGRVRDNLERRLRDAKLRANELQPADVRLGQAQAEVNSLESQLAAASK